MARNITCNNSEYGDFKGLNIVDSNISPKCEATSATSRMSTLPSGSPSGPVMSASGFQRGWPG